MLNSDCVLMPVMDELKGIKESGKVDRKMARGPGKIIYLHPFNLEYTKIFKFLDMFSLISKIFIK